MALTAEAVRLSNDVLLIAVIVTINTPPLNRYSLLCYHCAQ